jgi:hypothetical protein
LHPPEPNRAREPGLQADGWADRACLKVVEATRASLADGRDEFAVDAQLLDGPFIARTTQTIEAVKRIGLNGKQLYFC